MREYCEHDITKGTCIICFDKLKAELAKCTKTMDDGTLAIKILKQENAALKVLVKDLLHYWKTATPTIDDLIERANDATKE